jgi:hypothetical protein
MTSPDPVHDTPIGKPPTAPVGIRIASTTCWVVGIITILVAVAIGFPAISSGGSVAGPVVSLAAGIVVCVAAILVRRQRRLGVLLVVLAWATPFVIAIITHQSPAGSFLLFVALLFLLANWKHMR